MCRVSVHKSEERKIRNPSNKLSPGAFWSLGMVAMKRNQQKDWEKSIYTNTRNTKWVLWLRCQVSGDFNKSYQTWPNAWPKTKKFPLDFISMVFTVVLYRRSVTEWELNLIWEYSRKKWKERNWRQQVENYFKEFYYKENIEKRLLAGGRIRSR